MQRSEARICFTFASRCRITALSIEYLYDTEGVKQVKQKLQFFRVTANGGYRIASSTMAAECGLGTKKRGCQTVGLTAS